MTDILTLWPDDKGLGDIELTNMTFTDLWFFKTQTENELAIEVIDDKPFDHGGRVKIMSTGFDFYAVNHNSIKISAIRKITTEHCQHILLMMERKKYENSI